MRSGIEDVSMTGNSYEQTEYGIFVLTKSTLKFALRLKEKVCSKLRVRTCQKHEEYLFHLSENDPGWILLSVERNMWRIATSIPFSPRCSTKLDNWDVNVSLAMSSECNFQTPCSKRRENGDKLETLTTVVNDSPSGITVKGWNCNVWNWASHSIGCIVSRLTVFAYSLL